LLRQQISDLISAIAAMKPNLPRIKVFVFEARQLVRAKEVPLNRKVNRPQNQLAVVVVTLLRTGDAT